MASGTRGTRRRYRSAEEWPGWTDELAFTITGPTEADAHWAAENLNGDEYHHDGPTPDEVVDADAAYRGDPYDAEELAAESHQRDLMDRGLLPL